MKSKVIVYSPLPDDLLKVIHETCEVSYVESLKSSMNSVFLSELKDCEGILGSGLKVDKQLMDHAPQLKIVSNISVGYNNLDINELTRRNIMATNTPDVLTETTADTIFGLVIATARRMPELDHYVKSGYWKEKISKELFGVDVHHKTLGIIGMGSIGGAIARRAYHGFGMRILYHNRSRNLSVEQEVNADYCSLEELLKKSDFVCVMVPLSSETKNLIGEKEFQLMKKDAIFINGSRGHTVHEKDLIEALKNKEIAAAGLDVYQTEPAEPDNPLLKLNNVVTLPHIGSATSETRYNMAKLAVENLIKGIKGETPLNLINLEVKD